MIVRLIPALVIWRFVPSFLGLLLLLTSSGCFWQGEKTFYNDPDPIAVPASHPPVVVSEPDMMMDGGGEPTEEDSTEGKPHTRLNLPRPVSPATPSGRLMEKPRPILGSDPIPKPVKPVVRSTTTSSNGSTPSSSSALKPMTSPSAVSSGASPSKGSVSKSGTDKKKTGFPVPNNPTEPLPAPPRPSGR